MKKNLLVAAALVAFTNLSSAQSWTLQSLGLPTGSLGVTDLDAVDADNCWVICYDGSGGGANSIDFSKTNDGGNLWTAGTVNSDTILRFSNISALSGTEAWVAMFNNQVGAGGGLFHTTDGGLTWPQSNAGSIFDANSFPNVVHFNDPLNGWAMGDPNGGYYEMYTTTDGGVNWTRTPQANIPAPSTGEFGIVDRYFAKGNNIWFGTNKGRMFRSTDFGQTWAVTSVTTAARTIGTVAFRDSLNGLAVYTQGTTTVTYFLFKTVDGGATWSSVTPATGYFQQNIAHVPGTNTYVCTSLNQANPGSAYSDDDGLNWIILDQGIQQGAVDFVDNTIGWCGNFSDQVSTTDGGVYVYSGLPLSTRPVAEVSNINLYPNPSNGIVNINMVNKTKKPMTLTITNAIGEVVATSILTDVMINEKLDIAPYGSGLYLISIGNEISTSTSKVIVQ